ncbi:XdhC family protein [Ensifer sp.]|jgi:xanthine dehydrogenase accessory factor|uniref:XdhC family protein n=1 Tax=Ensifer sp. TaxID=1872086 RepID=UPI002E1422AA|nr:XdhC family protein [Ensifer sp.]
MAKTTASWGQFDDYVVDFALERSRSGEKVAIVTLVEIEGSSPRPLGAQMAVSETGDWTGYLSGGCVERAVVAEAVAAIERHENRRIRYGRGSKYFDIQLPCGSAIELVFDVEISRRALEAIDTRLHRRLPAAMRIPSADAAMTRIYAPRARLVVLGTGPSAVQLCRLGFVTGFEVVLFSPDRQTREEVLKFAGIEVVPILSPQSLPEVHADRHTAIAVMFHDHEWETNLLPCIVGTDAFYIGAMGSRKTHAQRLERLARAGVTQGDRDRIRGPAGLFESGKSASTIALSVLAEIMQTNAAVNGGDALFLENRPVPMMRAADAEGSRTSPWRIPQSGLV